MLLPPPINTTREASSPPRRVVTPTPEPTHELFCEENQDVFHILESIIKPEYLQPECFIQSTSADDFRQKILKVGSILRTQDNKEHFETLAKDRYDDTIHVDDEKKAKYKPLFDRFCCPFSKRAVQAFLRIAIKIDESSSRTNILQLTKYGGNGYGERLVAVIPADSPANLNKSAKQWLPKLCESIRGNDEMSQYDVWFNLIKLQHSINKCLVFISSILLLPFPGK